MTDPQPTPSFAAIVVAAGKGLRAGGETPKQFRHWRGKPLLRHSVETLASAGASPLIIVVSDDGEDTARAALSGVVAVKFITGGETRQVSVRKGLEAIERECPENVLIHDAARPDLPRAVIKRLLTALAAHSGAIPVLPVVDSLAIAHESGTMEGSADRDRLKRVQTPQAFRYAEILRAHRNWAGDPIAGDDAQVLAQNGGTVALVEGDERLRKITYSEDFMTSPASPLFRIGQGFDVHRLVEGEELWLCGVKIEHDKGLSGHSDADVALHAITDAVLGAIGDGDIGTHFPPGDPQWSGARSGRFLEHAVEIARDAGYTVGNIDLTIICEAPKIGPHRPAMRAEVARLAALDEAAVSIKATTTERLGFTGRGEGIAAQAIVSLTRTEQS
ncbi:bifunctional 2-C-methyl-D-erythritol 4-phosphate cytidylyltransferase/2-C-methyl-D-erythritol 2,4-cyclodiphosphate synthase [Erythrobacter sp. JK5]|uniref:bifunctional 2-C-methyl-D-erythritol 4-phosphate cytidylyltransferase/2-C-methyl-D-erythritol 2,4-cyclodiphosphate synthase n=1 Tax=Erythrobacter sp. JK5 TaxID=2829500 RepID=UPI001BAB1C67|nr:bifunctional 2-C-methyl-D-erythritol 4-phosphate cytidylyltransferase/2-C-methyl-D-erythritol 2,4-cyclodiphosphate synthase [Erythrobacter sp. JK5]QUL38688.1 bifunctional 2-C-methyl-D-erythritol 4-phosphate cytidylyltransferase/2-C-methyl-D-erythritol 2,4-cyclodiphosphate synthase [Erythrobacter sp. JK5]